MMSILNHKPRAAESQAEIARLLRKGDCPVSEKRHRHKRMGKVAKVITASAVVLGLAFCGVVNERYNVYINVGSCAQQSQSLNTKSGPISGASSNNWSGYVAAPKDFSSVSASWNVSCVDGSFAPKTSAQWVGLGNSSIIQAGTISKTVLGLKVYSTFYEVYPEPSAPLGLKVEPGDNVSANISLINAKNGLWRITVSDTSRSESVSRVVHYYGAHDTAEWIVEKPATKLYSFSLADFNVASFSNASASVSGVTYGLASLPNVGYSMVDGSGRQISVPSSLLGGGSFFVYYVNR